MTTTRNRVGLALALLALWLIWTTTLPELALWALFLVGLVAYVLPALRRG